MRLEQTQTIKQGRNANVSQVNQIKSDRSGQAKSGGEENQGQKRRARKKRRQAKLGEC